MRSSIFLAVAAAIATALAESSVVPVQQISDGQIQNPVTAPAPPNTTAVLSTAVATPAPPAVSAPPAPPASVATPAPPASVATPAPPAPPVAPKPSGGGVPPSYGNVTMTASKSNTITATVVKPSSAASPSASKPSVQTAGANTLVGSTIGLGFAAFVAVLFG